LDDAWEPFAAHQPVNGFDLQQVASSPNAFILRFNLGDHIIYLLQQ
jgi:hypothetical protein